MHLQQNLAAAFDQTSQLIDKEIPEQSKSLADNVENLEKVAQYCEDIYVQAPPTPNASKDKSHLLNETKGFTTQALASVAYQIHVLANSFLTLLDNQSCLVDDMGVSLSMLAHDVTIHKEKVARREIGVLTTNKCVTRTSKVKRPDVDEKSVKYVRKPIDYSSLDDVGHCVKVTTNPNIANSASLTPGIGRQNSYSSTHSTTSSNNIPNNNNNNVPSDPALSTPPMIPKTTNGAGTGGTVRSTGGSIQGGGSHYRTPVAPPAVPSEYLSRQELGIYSSKKEMQGQSGNNSSNLNSSQTGNGNAANESNYAMGGYGGPSYHNQQQRRPSQISNTSANSANQQQQMMGGNQQQQMTPQQMQIMMIQNQQNNGNGNGMPGQQQQQFPNQFNMSGISNGGDYSDTLDTRRITQGFLQDLSNYASTSGLGINMNMSGNVMGMGMGGMGQPGGNGNGNVRGSSQLPMSPLVQGQGGVGPDGMGMMPPIMGGNGSGMAMRTNLNNIDYATSGTIHRNRHPHPQLSQQASIYEQQQHMNNLNNLPPPPPALSDPSNNENVNVNNQNNNKMAVPNRTQSLLPSSSNVNANANNIEGKEEQILFTEGKVGNEEQHNGSESNSNTESNNGDEEDDDIIPNWVPLDRCLEKVCTTYDYESTREDELSFKEQTIIYVIKKNDDLWYEGILRCEETGDIYQGLFPYNYAKCLRKYDDSRVTQC